jgi:hypothetical protein
MILSLVFPFCSGSCLLTFLAFVSFSHHFIIPFHRGYLFSGACFAISRCAACMPFALAAATAATSTTSSAGLGYKGRAPQDVRNSSYLRQPK